MLRSPISFYTIDVGTLIVASSAHIRGKTIEEARSAVESASNGMKHVLEYAKAAGVKKIVYSGTFQNALHPLNSWNPITITENGKRDEHRYQARRPTEYFQTGILRQRTTATS